MRIGKTIITVRRETGMSLHDEVDTVMREMLADPAHELRRLMARVTRGEAKTYLDQAAQDHLDQFELHAAAVKGRLTAAFASELHSPAAVNVLDLPAHTTFTIPPEVAQP